ncbi:hypothetical protein POSPLADRAFT_1035546 [Postia placenta MAD-698-R-SB12]|uniref:Uncharacterized protein n=1 Tax=Postia placenta MAD-698-R-SB12 TaxID=670580 RepID=A0A1X6MSI7_9APHY|nr:hypothetical protein POSPLADRAFT_1035546 [Postia placenta MAD-698-R-SB12]OSX59172.1 hypothetical protein POSPLADRAFT_1035546 [Postia placenta MAD-698-R-SB12]
MADAPTPTRSLPDGQTVWPGTEHPQHALGAGRGSAHNEPSRSMVLPGTIRSDVQAADRPVETITPAPARSEPSSTVEIYPRSSSLFDKAVDLPFFEPTDPNRWPAEKVLFLAGFLFFPCWILGGFWKWRPRYDTFIIGGSVLVVELALRGR